MPLLSFAASHLNRDLATVEQLSVGADRLGAALVGTSIKGAVVLPTCNRFEVYIDAEDPAEARSSVVSALARFTALDDEAIRDALLSYEGDDAVHHLMAVTSGLESMVVGEREISGQVRRAHLEARESGHLSPSLDRLFQSALRTARVVGASTGIGTSGRSVLSVAFDLADELVAWPKATALVVGTGGLAESGVAVLRGKGAHIVGVYSPSGRGPEFGARHRMPVVERENLATVVSGVDVVLACSGGESIVLTPTLVAQAMEDRTRPLTLIDLALHRDVAPGVENLRDVAVVRLDDVKERAPEESAAAIESARAIVAHAVARYTGDSDARVVDPAIVTLREHVFGLLEREIARIRPEAGAGVGDIEQASKTEEALRRFAKALLHVPTVRARELAQAGMADQYLNALQTLYGLDVAVPTDACPADSIDSSITEASEEATR